MSLPVCIELYVSSKSSKIASMLYEAHRSWKAVEEFESIFSEWMFSVIASQYNFKIDDERIHVTMTSMLGLIGNICGLYAHGYERDYREIVENLLKFIATFVGFHIFDVKDEVEKIADIVEKSDITVCGYRIGDLDTQLSA